MKTLLSQLKSGQTGIIKKIRGSGHIQKRIIDMGVVPGTKVVVEKFAPLTDPMEIKIKGYNLSLRKAEAEFIEVELVNQN